MLSPVCRCLFITFLLGPSIQRPTSGVFTVNSFESFDNKLSASQACSTESLAYPRARCPSWPPRRKHLHRSTLLVDANQVLKVRL